MWTLDAMRLRESRKQFRVAEDFRSSGEGKIKGMLRDVGFLPPTNSQYIFAFFDR